MSGEETWDAAKIARECKEAADAKTGRRGRRGEIPKPEVTSEVGSSGKPYDPETGTFTSTYKPEFAERARRWAELGATHEEIAEWLEISRSTFYQWRHDHEDFAEAVKLGTVRAIDRVENAMFSTAVGYDYVEEQAVKVKIDKDTERVEIVQIRKHQPADPKAAMKILVNKRSEDWRERRDVVVQGQIEHVTPAQARREALAMLEQHPELLALPAPSRDTGTKDDLTKDF